MNAKTAYPLIERYAETDFDEILAQANKKWTFDGKLIDIDITEEILEEGVESKYYITGIFEIDGLTFSLTYHCYDNINEDELIFDEIYPQDLHDAYMHRYYMSMNQKWDAKDFKDKLESKGLKTNAYVESATSITAADEDEDDPFSDMEFEDEQAPVADDGDISDNIDDLSDTLDDISDSLEDFKEDNVDIELDNNISDHYIAECEKCKGVFITSITESDMELEKISGICPICDEECDQYLKWVIRDCNE